VEADGVRFDGELPDPTTDAGRVVRGQMAWLLRSMPHEVDDQLTSGVAVVVYTHGQHRLMVTPPGSGAAELRSRELFELLAALLTRH
jgi:hypothetical protein